MSGAVLDPRLQPARAAPRKRAAAELVGPAVPQHRLAGGHHRRGRRRSVWYLVSNTTRNLEQRQIATGFAFLGRIAGIPIGEYLIPYDPAVNTYGRALAHRRAEHAQSGRGRRRAGHHLGHVGRHRPPVAQLADRQARRGLRRGDPRHPGAAAAVLLVLGAAGRCRAPRQSFHPLPGVFLSNRGVKIPLRRLEPTRIGGACSRCSPAPSAPGPGRARRRKRQEQTGVRPRVWPVALGLLVVLPLAVWAALGAPFAPDVPELRGFNFSGGATLSPEYGALTLGLVHLHRRLHRRDRPLRHPGRWRPASGRRRARSGCAAAPCCARSCCRRRCG